MKNSEEANEWLEYCEMLEFLRILQKLRMIKSWDICYREPLPQGTAQRGQLYTLAWINRLLLHQYISLLDFPTSLCFHAFMLFKYYVVVRQCFGSQWGHQEKKKKGERRKEGREVDTKPLPSLFAQKTATNVKRVQLLLQTDWLPTNLAQTPISRPLPCLRTVQ